MCRKDEQPPAAHEIITALKHAELEIERLTRAERRALEKADAEAAERRRGEIALLESEQRLTALHNMLLSIRSHGDLQDAVTLFLERGSQQLRGDIVCILLPHADTGALAIAGCFDRRPPTARRRPAPINFEAAEQAMREMRLVQIVPRPSDRGTGRARREQFAAGYAMPLIARGQAQGVLEVYHCRPITLDASRLAFVESLVGIGALALDATTLSDALARTYDATIDGWSSLLDLRDREIEGHSRRVAAMTVALARRIHVPEEDIDIMRRGALLHDIGKLGISDSILLKPGPLTAEEWESIRRHPSYAYEMLATIPFFRPLIDIPYCHHEKWDGTGYPRGLCGDEIPLGARIFKVADVWDALQSNRPYRESWPMEQVRDYIRDLAGADFDPVVVEAFLRLTSTPESLAEGLRTGGLES